MTTLQLGWTNPLTGAFAAHPTLGGPLDLNDGATYTLVSPEGLELPLPPRTLVPVGNVRTRGERAARAIHRGNREARCQLILGPMQTYADLVATIRTLLSWVNAAPQVPVTLQYQPPSATAPVYLDVAGAAVDIPSDEDQWLALQLEPITLVFWCRPGLRGDRVALQNLAWNPGFEAPSGAGVPVFADSFANVNAYALVAGSAPSVSANLMTIPASTTITFGSPAWGPISLWQIRFQYTSGQFINLMPHRTDANNWLGAEISTNNITLFQVVGGTAHSLASATPALTSGNYYWLQMSMFPYAGANQPVVSATLYADSAGSLGAAVSGGAVSANTYDAVTALTGPMAMQSGTSSLKVGGPVVGTPTNLVSLFGPGAWAFTPSTGGSTGQCSGAWDGARPQAGTSGSGAANTYAGGPATSFGAARVDFPPAGTANAVWNLYGGGAPAGTWAMPVAVAGDALSASAWVRTTGLGADAAINLTIAEYNASGTRLRQTTVAALTGNHASWTQLAGAVTTGAGCAYADLLLNAADVSAPGASANASVWWDNVQVWDQTAVAALAPGQASMPYCELRFPQSPAQLLVSGLLGDLPSPCYAGLGTYLASWAPGASLSVLLGRRNGFSASAQLASPSHGLANASITYVLDPASYGGYYLSALTTSSGWNPRAFSDTVADLAGVYHLWSRFQSNQGAGNLPNVQQRVLTAQSSLPWFDNASLTDLLGEYYGPWVAPLGAPNTWTLCDAGQCAIPPFPQGALVDPTQNYVVPRAQCEDTTGGGSTLKINWQMLLPIDGSLLAGIVNNAGNAPYTVTQQWLWLYVDGLLVNRAGVSDGPSWTYSVEAGPLANPARGAGGAGTQSTGTINANYGADPYLTLDPTIGGGVNQLAGVISDNTGDVLAMAMDLVYTPLYLEVR